MRQNRTNLVLGLLLVLIGVWLVVTRQVPAIQNWLEDNMSWPLSVIGVGVLVLLIGLFMGAPGMAVPASIIAGVGGILYYQNATGNFGSWYLWALVPGFVGVGTMLTGLLGENTGRNLAHGLNLIVVSVVIFLLLATLFGGLSILGDYGAAIILILLGVYLLIRGVVRSGGFRGHDETR